MGCSANGAAKDNKAETVETVDKSDRASRVVIEWRFNGPDEKYKALWEAQTLGKYIDDYKAFLESPEYQELMNYTKETYASYFTETPSLMFFTENTEELYKEFTDKNITAGEMVDMPSGKMFNFTDNEDNYFAVMEKINSTQKRTCGAFLGCRQTRLW